MSINTATFGLERESEDELRDSKSDIYTYLK